MTRHEYLKERLCKIREVYKVRVYRHVKKLRVRSESNLRFYLIVPNAKCRAVKKQSYNRVKPDSKEKFTTVY